jgi:hypothetical protein
MIRCRESKDAKRKRMEGGGCKVLSEDLDRILIQWIFTMRRRGLRVSRKMIRVKAQEVFAEVEDTTRAVFKASRGWLDRFMKRNGLSVRRRTTVAQKTPEMMTEKMVSFIRYMERARAKTKVEPSEVYAMDETAVWFDMLSQSTVEKQALRVCQ